MKIKAKRLHLPIEFWVDVAEFAQVVAESREGGFSVAEALEIAKELDELKKQIKAAKAKRDDAS
jgi:hypothetical protein